MGYKMFEVKNIHDTLCYVTDIMCSKESEGGWVSVTGRTPFAGVMVDRVVCCSGERGRCGLDSCRTSH